MSGKEKMEYLWMYYKVWLLVPLGLIAVIYLGVTMCRGMTEDVLLYLVITDSEAATGENQTVSVNTSLSNATYQGEIAFTTLVGAESVD